MPGMGITANSRILSQGLRNIAAKRTAETAPEAPMEEYHGCLPVTDDIRNGCRRHTPEIEKQESPFAKTQIAESCLNVLSERPKCKHVHQQVHPVSMYESVRQDAPPLSLLYHPLRFQCQSFKQVLPVETGQRYAECSCNNQVGEHIT